MGKMKDIKNAIMTQLSAMGSTADGTKLVTVKDNTRGTFQGYPAAEILPSRQQNDVETNVQQLRTPEYAVLLHIPMEDTPESESLAYDTMYDLVDLIMDTFDTASFDLGVGTLLFETTLADYQVATLKNGVTLLVRIDLRARYTKDIIT